MTQHCPQLIKQCCRDTSKLSGDLAEVGVWRGDSALVILENTTASTLFLYDTFAGMPAEMTAADEYHKPGTWSDTSIEMVREKLKHFAERIELRPGVFPHTMGDEGPFRFVHIDCDQYLSTLAAVSMMAERVVVGGVILLDDYGCSTTFGAKRAVDEWRARHTGWAFTRSGTRGILRQTEALYVGN